MPDSKAMIRNIPDDAIVIKADVFSTGNIFRGKKGECKRADFVIISPGKKHILYIEIKKRSDEWGGIVKQLMGAQCFIRYCRDIGRTFWNERDFLSGYRSRFISIGHTSISKRKTRITRQQKRHDTPENAMKIDWPIYLQYNRLVGA